MMHGQKNIKIFVICLRAKFHIPRYDRYVLNIITSYCNRLLLTETVVTLVIEVTNVRRSS